MSVSVEVPALGESVTEAIIAEWLKSEGDFIQEDETLVELETDKITVSVPSPVTGKIVSLKASLDDTVEVGDVIAEIEPGDAPESDGDSDDSEDSAEAEEQKEEKDDKEETDQKHEKEKKDQTDEKAENDDKKPAGDQPLSPAVQRLVDENDLDASKISASGPNGRLLKGDVLEYLDKGGGKEKKSEPKSSGASAEAGELEERVKMSKLRQTVAKRLVQAQQDAAMLTTFNEVDMTAVMELRSKWKMKFADKYDIKLGFMSFFVKAAVEALKAFPAVNAEIDGDHIVYKNYYHIGVAVGGPKGLVVPVVRDADQMSFADVEQEISRLADKAMNNKLGLDDMRGGTFTISNGGIYGSMLSTPILNPPQVGILGMHNIVERPVAIDGEIDIRPIMYLALSYDHRIIDGKEAVSFLVRLKECIEEPERILLEI